MKQESDRHTLILASRSPRRHELLRKMGVAFRVIEADVDESTDAPPEKAVVLLAERKARAVARGLQMGLVLAADTLVSLDEKALGKPQDKAEARRMLRALSGREHDVYTGLCLLDVAKGRIQTGLERTHVHFFELSDEQIDAYIQTGEPMDAAGSYRIQGAADVFIRSIEGSYENVMGLPTQAVKRMLAAFLQPDA